MEKVEEVLAWSYHADVRAESMCDQMKSLHSSPCVKCCKFLSLASSLRSLLLPVVYLASVSVSMVHHAWFGLHPASAGRSR